MKKLIFVLLLAIPGLSANAQCTKLFDFTKTTGYGFYFNSLYTDGAFLYGMTVDGGTYNYGTIFKIKPDGSGYVKLLDFDGSTNGSSPVGALFSDGNCLYGMTQSVGKSRGTIFKIKPDGRNYVKLFDFADYKSGWGPLGFFTSHKGQLYGMTSMGGTKARGTTFKINRDGSGFEEIMDFYSIENGYKPRGALLSDGRFLYGMTLEGGLTNDSVGNKYGYGTVFKMKPDGSGFEKLLNFTGANGRFPEGSLISDGTFLYGMTEMGGKYDGGTVFKIKPDGSGYMQLLDFAGIANGSCPYGSLYYDGDFLYGTTRFGGKNGDGTAFKIKPDGSGYVKLLDFENDITGRQPVGSLVSDGRFLYGMTMSGGKNDKGTIFKIQIDSSYVPVEITSDSTANTNNEILPQTFIPDSTAANDPVTDHVIAQEPVIRAAITIEEENIITIYPNPANEKITIENSALNNDATISIFNNEGQLVLQQTTNQAKTEIAVSTLANGLYFVKVNNESGIAVKRFIKE